MRQRLVLSHFADCSRSHTSVADVSEIVVATLLNDVLGKGQLESASGRTVRSRPTNLISQAALVVTIAKAQNRLFGETQNFLAAREFRDTATDVQKHELLHCLFAVSALLMSIKADMEIWASLAKSLRACWTPRSVVRVRQIRRAHQDTCVVDKKGRLGPLDVGERGGSGKRRGDERGLR